MPDEKQIYTEVYMTLSKYDKESIDKIPEEIKEDIINKADTSFPFKIDKLLPESEMIINSILDNYINK